MIYLFVQTWGWIFTAGLLGLFIGWLIWGKRNARDSADAARLRRQLDECREQCKELELAVEARPHKLASPSKVESISQEIPKTPISVEPEPAADKAKEDVIAETDDDTIILDSWKPAALSGPEGEADDLKRIKGIGPVIEKTLNELGVYHFRQIAAFTEENIRWVDNYIAFPGRIQRENWVSQAKELESGGQTEFSNRYDKK